MNFFIGCGTSRFSTYSESCIGGNIQRFIRKNYMRNCRDIYSINFCFHRVEGGFAGLVIAMQGK